MPKTATQRDANRILTLAKKGAALASSSKSAGGGSVPVDDRLAALFTQIALIAKAIDASTGRRDSSTKKRRSRAAKRKRVTG